VAAMLAAGGLATGAGVGADAEGALNIRVYSPGPEETGCAGGAGASGRAIKLRVALPPPGIGGGAAVGVGWSFAPNTRVNSPAFPCCPDGEAAGWDDCALNRRVNSPA
jgi:hypothetical protein